MFELSIKGDIASGHYLRGYEGRCRDLHGHTWQVEVVVMSGRLDKTGMVADFLVLKKKLKEFLETIDHVCLNDLPYFQKINPTTENIARYIYQNFGRDIAPLKIKRVQVWESGTSGVAYYE